jgi:hypothetical protein
LFVLGKIDEVLTWEQRRESERETKFVELGRYLCEVRAGQYWRIEKLKSFDELLERRFPESRRKAYYSCPFTSSCRRIAERTEGNRLDERPRVGQGAAGSAASGCLEVPIM